MTKKLIATFFTLLFIFSAILIVKNKDIISEYITSAIYDSKSNDTIAEGNEYERNYNYITFKEINSSNIKNKEDIINLFYTILNKGITKYTFYCPSEYENCSKEVIEIANDSQILSLINNYINPLNSYNTFNITVTNDREILVEVDKYYKDAEITPLNQKIDIIINQLNLNKLNISDKIKKVHDYLIATITYDEEYKAEDGITPSNKATGAILNGKSVCGGYADALAIMLDRLNIPNFKVSSKEHIWNVVYISGEWKHVDVTWDDDENNPNNNHNFLLITTEKLHELDLKEHTFNKNDYKEIK